MNFIYDGWVIDKHIAKKSNFSLNINLLKNDIYGEINFNDYIIIKK